MTPVRELVAVAFTPIARAMSAVNPATLTLVSVAAGVASGLAFACAGRGSGWYVAAGLLIGMSGSADALDGLVARLHGKVSVRGDFLDHVGDRLVEVCILAGIAASPGASPVFGLSVVILTLLTSYLGTQIEATFGHRAYSGLGKAEQFIGLIVFACVLAAAPSFSVPVGGLRLSAANVFFALLGAATLAGLVYRLRLGLSMAREATEPRRTSPVLPEIRSR